MALARIKLRDLFAQPPVDQQVLVKGWVRTARGSKKIAFIELSDGSCQPGLQLVVDRGQFDEELLKQVTTGAAIAASGLLVQSQGQGQSLEMQVATLEVYGSADGETYPLQKKKHSLEFLREIAHLRPRTRTFGAVLRVRHTLAYAVHEFFHQRGFFYLHAPILTGSDSEGAGQMFQVTTLPLENVPKDDKGGPDYSQDFFGQAARLTVSGQLEAELGALGLSDVYTFGPTFRAENSNTARHLAEFWMIEPEMAFYDNQDNMSLGEALLKFVIDKALQENAQELAFLAEAYDEGLLPRLRGVLQGDFVRLPYTEAVDILKASGKTFEFPVDWGTDLQSEHERYLVEEHFHKPVILYDYPASIKAFYMRLNDDGKTVAAMDVLFPGIGEIIGGSQREERLEVLERRIKEFGLPEEEYGWYLDTRRFGSAPHSGFGLGFERLVQFVTGMHNIRDVIPFPRTPGNLAF